MKKLKSVKAKRREIWFENPNLRGIEYVYTYIHGVTGRPKEKSAPRKLGWTKVLDIRYREEFAGGHNYIHTYIYEKNKKVKSLGTFAC